MEVGGQVMESRMQQQQEKVARDRKQGRRGNPRALRPSHAAHPAHSSQPHYASHPPAVGAHWDARFHRPTDQSLVLGAFYQHARGGARACTGCHLGGSSFSWCRFDRSYKTVPLPLAAYEIAHRDGASKLVGYVLADYNPSPGEENGSLTTPLAQPPYASSSPTRSPPHHLWHRRYPS
ncbi:hypothetical protein FIBSPDRAFT_864463 [Athelia psychrophila]|uniref:Uncharacterized protein n=1 Tax=Athelia psychrophila TaxID=1759441 RepID=A0A166GHC6_9AGAM|nr:hypothetical protein FIBSPDRAFT_864463 [Fibularhizoctonia sp. CBS 109695]